MRIHVELASWFQKSGGINSSVNLDEFYVGYSSAAAAASCHSDGIWTFI